MASGSIAVTTCILLFGITCHAQVATPNPVGVLARDRAISGISAVIKEAANIATDTANHYRAIRIAESNKGVAGVTAAMANYQIDVANNGLDLQLEKGIFLFQKSIFMAGGPVGEAAAGLWTVTMDRLIERQAEERNDQAQILLKKSLRSLNSNEFDALLKEGSSGKASTRFRKHIEDTLNAAAGGEATGQKTVTDELMSLSFAMEEKQLRKLYDLSNKQDITLAAVKTSLGKLDALNNSVKILGANMEVLAKRAERVEHDVQLIRFEGMDAKAKADYLRAGGLAHIENRDDLLMTLDTQAKFDAARHTLEIMGAGLNALHAFSSNVLKDPALSKTVSDAASIVQAAQFAQTIFAAFTPTGSALTAFQAFGGLSSMMGPRQSGNAAEMAVLTAQLQRVIELQLQTLRSLQSVHSKLDKLQGSVDQLSNEMKIGFATAMEAQHKGVYGDCLDLLRSDAFRTSDTDDMGAAISLPFDSAESFTRYHFLTVSRWEDLKSDKGNRCYLDLAYLMKRPSQIRQIGQVEVEGKRSPVLAKEEERLRDIHAYMRAHLERRMPQSQTTSNMQLGMALALTSPSTTLWDMRRHYALRMRKPVENLERPCWWRSKLVKTCTWAGAQVGSENVEDLTGNDLIHAWQLVKVLDLGLSFYPQNLLPDTLPMVTGSKGMLNATAFAAAMDNKLKSTAGRDARYMLVDAVRIADASVAHEAMLEGDIVAEMIARDLLDPPMIVAGTPLDKKVAVEGSEVVPADRLDPTCTRKWANHPAGVAAPANAFMLRNPQIAYRALQLVLHHSLFPSLSRSGVSARVVLYEAARANSPFGHAMRTFYKEMNGLGGVTPTVPSGADQRVRSWWKDVFRLDEKTVRLTINGQPTSVRHVGRGFELHYAYIDGLATSVSIIRRTKDGDNPKTTCNGYTLTEEKISLPRGWSISAGGLVMSLPDAAVILVGSIDKGIRLKAVMERQDLLKSELASLIVPIDSSLKPLLKYQLARRAYASVGGSK